MAIWSKPKNGFKKRLSRFFKPLVHFLYLTFKGLKLTSTMQHFLTILKLLKQKVYQTFSSNLCIIKRASLSTVSLCLLEVFTNLIQKNFKMATLTAMTEFVLTSGNSNEWAQVTQAQEGVVNSWAWYGPSWRHFLWNAGFCPVSKMALVILLHQTTFFSSQATDGVCFLAE